MTRSTRSVAQTWSVGVDADTRAGRSAEADDRVGCVGLLEAGDLVGGELEVDGGDGVVEVRRLGRPDDRRGDDRLGAAATPAPPGRAARRARRRPRRPDRRSPCRRGSRASCRTRRSPTGRWPRPSRGSAGRGPAGSTGSRRRPGRRTAAASRAPPRGRAGCSGSASTRTASSRARSAVYCALENCHAYIDDAPM